MPRDFHQGLPLPKILGSWEFVLQIPTAFLSAKAAGGCPTNPRSGYSCQAFSEENDAHLLQTVKVYQMFGFGRDWAGEFLLDSSFRG